MRLLRISAIAKERKLCEKKVGVVRKKMKDIKYYLNEVEDAYQLEIENALSDTRIFDDNAFHSLKNLTGNSDAAWSRV